MSSFLGAEVEAQALQSQVPLLAAGPGLVFPVPAGFQRGQGVIPCPVGRQTLLCLEAGDGPGGGVPAPLLLQGARLAVGQADAIGLVVGDVDALFQPGVPYEEALSLGYCGTIRARFSTVHLQGKHLS